MLHKVLNYRCELRPLCFLGVWTWWKVPSMLNWPTIWRSTKPSPTSDRRTSTKWVWRALWCHVLPSCFMILHRSDLTVLCQIINYMSSLSLLEPMTLWLICPLCFWTFQVLLICAVIVSSVCIRDIFNDNVVSAEQHLCLVATSHCPPFSLFCFFLIAFPCACLRLRYVCFLFPCFSVCWFCLWNEACLLWRTVQNSPGNQVFGFFWFFF